MVYQVYQLPKKDGGQDLLYKDALHRVAQVSLGKRTIIFRLGQKAYEHAPAIKELAQLIRNAKAKSNRPIVRFNPAICRCIAAAALFETTIDMCFVCKGAGEIQDHSVEDLEGRQPMTKCPSCHGTNRWQYSEDERVLHLARAWAGCFPGQHPEDPEAVSAVAAALRKEPRLKEILKAVDFAKHQIRTCERVATEEAAAMLGRM